MWEDSREALADLRVADCDRVLDVGCGTGELSRVLAEETDGAVVGLDRDRSLLARAPVPTVQGDALSLPFPDDSVDCVVCQALLINLPDPGAAVREFARVATDRVAAIEPDNSAVSVTSTVAAEAPLARRARALYLTGVETDVDLGADAAGLFREAGLTDVRTRRYDHERTVAPPYSAAAVEAARRKATGAGIESDRETLLAGAATPADLDALRESWREMGREAVEQMQAGDYRRREVVPFFVTVGAVGGD
ncbi:MAG: class I SAM-dependent methyltransferase [Haloarculaceae archaeon]